MKLTFITLLCSLVIFFSFLVGTVSISILAGLNGENYSMGVSLIMLGFALIATIYILNS